MKHTWIKNDYDDEPDVFAYEVGYHNGPRCADCGFYFCKHCDNGWDTECGTNPIPGQASKLGAGYAYSEAVRGSLGLSPIQREG